MPPASCSAAPTIRAACLQRVLLSIKLSFQIEPNQLKHDEKLLQWTCCDLLRSFADLSQQKLAESVSTRLVVDQLLQDGPTRNHNHEPRLQLSASKQIIPHCCTDSPLFIRLLFILGRFLLPKAIAAGFLQLQEDQVPAFVIESLWLFFTPWIGELRSTQICRPCPSDVGPQLHFLHLPCFCLPPVLPVPLFSRLLDDPLSNSLSQQSLFTDRVPVLELSYRTVGHFLVRVCVWHTNALFVVLAPFFFQIFWSFIAASFLPASALCGSLVLKTDSQTFTTLTQLREVLQGILRFHLRSKKVRQGHLSCP